MRRELKRLSQSWTAMFAVVIAALGPTLLSLPWVDDHLGASFLSEMLVVAVGLPCLIVLARKLPLVTIEPADSKRSPPRNRAGRAPTPQRRRRPVGRKVDPAAKEPELLRVAARLAVALGVWVLVATVLSPHPVVALLGLQFRATGALLGLSLVAAWALGVSVGRDAAAAIESVLLGVVGLNAIIALVQGTFGVGLAFGRAPGVFGNPVFLAGLLIGGLWLVVQQLRNDQRWGWAAVLVVAAIQTSGSRSALLLLPVVVLASFGVLTRRRTALLIVAVVAGLAVGGGLAAYGGESSATARASRGNTTSGLSERFDVWTWSVHAVIHRPVQGEGPGQLQEATQRYETLAYARGDPEGYFDDAHNLIVEYAVTTGIPGALLLIAFAVVALLLAGWRSPLAGFAILVLAVHGLEPQHAELTPVLFLALGAAASGPAPLLIGVPRGLRPALISVAVVVGGVIGVGSGYATASPNSASHAYADVRLARRLLPMWSFGYLQSANVDAAESKFNPATTKGEAHWLEVAAQHEPDQAALWTDLATVEEQNGDLGAAESHYRRALADNRYSVNALDGLIELLERAGRSQEARQYVVRSLQVNPNQPTIRKFLP